MVIKQAVKSFSELKDSPKGLKQPHEYDLHIHESDGFPSDFKLDRDKLAKEYMSYKKVVKKDRSGYDEIVLFEFCLVERRVKSVGSGVVPVDISAVKPAGGVGVGDSVTVSIAEQKPTTLAIDSTTTTTELLGMLAKRHRLKLHTDSYVFRLRDQEDQTRLMWMSDEIDKSVKLLALGHSLFSFSFFCLLLLLSNCNSGIKFINFERKVFADTGYEFSFYILLIHSR